MNRAKDIHSSRGGFQSDNARFIDSYEMGMKEYMETYEEWTIDLTGKVVVVIGECMEGERKTPCYIGDMYGVEDGNKDAKLVYCGHITFLYYKSLDGKECISYVDDEPWPMVMKDYEQDSNAIYNLKEAKFKMSDLRKQVEMAIKSFHDFNFVVTGDNVIFLEGL